MSQYNEYVATGAVTQFAYKFPAFELSDLAVSVDGVPQSSGFAVYGLGGGNGGVVEFATAPANGAVIRIARAKVPPQVAYLVKDENLADVADVAEARINLGLGSAAVMNVGTTAGNLVQLDSSARLPAVDGSQLTNVPFGRLKVSSADAQADFLEAKLVAGSNITLTKESSDGVETLRVASHMEQAIVDGLEQVEVNQALGEIRDLRSGAKAPVLLAGGIVDAFSDQTGSGNTGGTYSAAGHCYSTSNGIYGADITPVMTSDTAPSGYVAICDSYMASYNPYRAFNGVLGLSNCWQNINCSYPCWIGMQFPAQKRVSRYGFAQSNGGADYRSTQWVFEGSNDGAAWTILHSYNGASFGSQVMHYHNIAYPGFYDRYRLRLLAGNGISLVVDEVEMFEDDAALDMTLVSVASTALASPSFARVVLLHEPIVAVTLNSDLFLDISRDNGTTWSIADLVNQGSAGNGLNIVSALVDLSSQPAGTAMKWRLRTQNQKLQRFHGVALTWR
ncbi:MAG: hypothetical protein H7X89_12770 [Rhizobiales bacterium]|nr:hypothetical protein [Hyphomicrobiales bacterium]